CFKRYGMKESDYKVEMHGYQELKRYVDSLDEQDTSEATNWVLAKLRGSIGSTSTSAGTQQVGAATSTSSTSSSKAAVDLVNVKPESKPVVSPRSISTSVAVSDDVEKAHNKMVRSMIERSHRVYALLYECLSDDIRELVNNNSAIVDGYGYSLRKWLEVKYQSTEGASLGKLWSDLTTVKQREFDDFEKHKSEVD